VDPGDWIGVAVRLMEPHFRTGPALILSLPPAIPPVLGDAQLLIQCLVNLLLNARDAASSAEGGGRVTLGAEVREALLAVTVEDDGPGVPQPVRERLFEPFVTTKNHGSGLGLFFVDSALRGMGGRIRLADEACGGTRFELTLPVTNGPGDPPGEGDDHE
jgi:signal transduction histidine kinase